MKIISVLVCIGSICGIPSAYAEELTLSLSPSIIEVVAQPGSEVLAPVTITNKGGTTQAVSFSFKRFKKLSEDGAVTFTDKDDNSSSSFFTLTREGEKLSSEIRLRPDESAALMLAIDVPREPTPSDYYQTLLFQTKNELKQKEDQTASKIEPGIGTNILLSIRDEQNPPLQAKLAEFVTEKFMLTDTPINFVLRVENGSDYFIKAVGRIDLVDVEGTILSTIVLPEQYILAKSARNLTRDASGISAKGLFGKYEAKAAVTIGDAVLAEKTTLYVIPKHMLIITLPILAAFLILVSRVRLYMLKKQSLSHRIKKKKK